MCDCGDGEARRVLMCGLKTDESYFDSSFRWHVIDKRERDNGVENMCVPVSIETGSGAMEEGVMITQVLSPSAHTPTRLLLGPRA